MVRYYCNKCGSEIHSKMLKIVTSDSDDKKKAYHLCYVCSLEFNKFIKGREVSSEVNDTVVTSDGVNNSEDTGSDELPVKNVYAEGYKSGGRSKLSNEAIKYIEDNMSEKSASQIAKELGVQYQTVYYYFRSSSKKNEFGEVNPEASNGLSANEVGTAMALYRAGWSIENIAKELYKDIEDVTAVLQENNMLEVK